MRCGRTIMQQQQLYTVGRVDRIGVDPLAVHNPQPISTNSRAT